MALWSCHSGVQPTWCASSKVSGWGWSGGTLLRRVIGLAGLFFLALGFRALLAVLLLVSQSSVVVVVAVVFSPSVGGSAAILAMLSEDKLRLVVAVLESSTEVLIWSPLQLLARRMRREHCQRTSPPVVEPLRSVKDVCMSRPCPLLSLCDRPDPVGSFYRDLLLASFGQRWCNLAHHFSAQTSLQRFT